MCAIRYLNQVFFDFPWTDSGGERKRESKSGKINQPYSPSLRRAEINRVKRWERQVRPGCWGTGTTASSVAEVQVLEPKLWVAVVAAVPPFPEAPSKVHATPLPSSLRPRRTTFPRKPFKPPCLAPISALVTPSAGAMFRLFWCRGALGEVGVLLGPDPEDAVRVTASPFLPTPLPAFSLPLLAGWGVQAWVRRDWGSKFGGPGTGSAGRGDGGGNQTDPCHWNWGQKAGWTEGSLQAVPSANTTFVPDPRVGSAQVWMVDLERAVEDWGWSTYRCQLSSHFFSVDWLSVIFGNWYFP